MLRAGEALSAAGGRSKPKILKHGGNGGKIGGNGGFLRGVNAYRRSSWMRQSFHSTTHPKNPPFPPIFPPFPPCFKIFGFDFPPKPGTIRAVRCKNLRQGWLPYSQNYFQSTINFNSYSNIASAIHSLSLSIYLPSPRFHIEQSLVLSFRVAARNAGGPHRPLAL